MANCLSEIQQYDMYYMARQTTLFQFFDYIEKIGENSTCNDSQNGTGEDYYDDYPILPNDGWMPLDMWMVIIATTYFVVQLLATALVVQIMFKVRR